MRAHREAWTDEITRRHLASQPVTSGRAKAKYLNVKTLASDGTPCDSKTEAKRWEELLLLQRAGEIRDVLPHPSFPLVTNGTKTGRITFDSLYVRRGQVVVEDVKSPRTAAHGAYRQRLRTFRACYPHIAVHEEIR